MAACSWADDSLSKSCKNLRPGTRSFLMMRRHPADNPCGMARMATQTLGSRTRNPDSRCRPALRAGRRAALSGPPAHHGPARKGAWLRVALPGGAGGGLPRRWRPGHPHHARQYGHLRAGKAHRRPAGLCQLHPRGADREHGPCPSLRHDGAGDSGKHRAHAQPDRSLPQAEGRRIPAGAGRFHLEARLRAAGPVGRLHQSRFCPDRPA